VLDSKKVDGLDVNVDVMNGKVKLTGWASSTAERAKATELARAVKGVKSVDNQIKLKDCSPEPLLRLPGFKQQEGADVLDVLFA
jgi:hypothetical protein